MKLTAPLHVLKSQAKALKRHKNLTMVEALDHIAQGEGFSSWSLLQSKAKDYQPRTVEEVLDWLFPGDMLLIGARPGLGKTRLTLEVLLLAMQQQRRCFFYSFEFVESQLLETLQTLEPGYEALSSFLQYDLSDDISASSIIEKSAPSMEKGAIIAIDYLQLLDQQRDKPPLQTQIEMLKSFAKEERCCVMCISQIDRRYIETEKQLPELADVRLPNPLDLSLFNKTIFLEH